MCVCLCVHMYMHSDVFLQSDQSHKGKNIDQKHLILNIVVISSSKLSHDHAVENAPCYQLMLLPP